MDNKIAAIKEQFLAELSKAENSADLEAIRVAYLGKKGFVTELMKEMKDLSVEEKKTFGQKVNVIKGEVTDKIAEKNQELKEKELLMLSGADRRPVRRRRARRPAREGA